MLRFLLCFFLVIMQTSTFSENETGNKESNWKEENEPQIIKLEFSFHFFLPFQTCVKSSEKNTTSNWNWNRKFLKRRGTEIYFLLYTIININIFLIKKRVTLPDLRTDDKNVFMQEIDMRFCVFFCLFKSNVKWQKKKI